MFIVTCRTEHRQFNSNNTHKTAEGAEGHALGPRQASGTVQPRSGLRTMLQKDLLLEKVDYAQMVLRLMALVPSSAHDAAQTKH